MTAEHAADQLRLELTAAGVPFAFRCYALEAVENWLRYLMQRGGMVQRIGFALALEAVKHARKQLCPQPEAES